MFDKIERLLIDEGARFRVVVHEAEGNSILVAKLRNTRIGQGAKAMLCRMRRSDFNVMTVVPGDRRVDLNRVARHFGYARAGFMAAEDAVELTGCVIGAIPPFSLDGKWRLVADLELIEKYQDIAFNAGALDKSIVLATVDYLRIARPIVADISML